MASSKRRGLERGRKKQNREKRKRHLIVSNGKVTEGEYFNTVIEDLNVRGSVRYQFIDGILCRSSDVFLENWSWTRRLSV